MTSLTHSEASRANERYEENGTKLGKQKHDLVNNKTGDPTIDDLSGGHFNTANYLPDTVCQTALTSNWQS